MLLILMGTTWNQLLTMLENSLPFFSFVRTSLAVLIGYATFTIISMPFNGNVYKKASILFSFTMIGFASEFLSYLIKTFIFQKRVDEAFVESLLHDQIILLSGFLMSLFVAAIRIISYKIVKKQSMTRIHMLELAVPILSTIVCCYLVQIDVQVMVFTGIIFLVINVIVLLAYNQQEQYYKRTHEYSLQKQHDKFREEHYRTLEAHQSEIRAMKHDLKNQIIVMDSYMKTGSMNLAREQLVTLIEQLSNSDKYIFTEHAGINGLLAMSYKKAKEEGIVCDFNIQLPSNAGIADIDLVTLVGNILDNAIEACLNCNDKPYIRMEMMKQNNTLLLRCENSTDGKSKSIKTNKEDPINHGIGIKTVRQIVEKYDGELQYHFTSYHFVLEFTLFL